MGQAELSTSALGSEVGTGTRRLVAALAWLLPVVAIAGVAGRRWWQLGGYVSGLDAGQWFAIGRGLFGEGRSTSGAYAPLVPLLLHAGRTVAEPMTVARVAAIASLAAVMGATYLVARGGMGTWFAAAAAATVGMAGVVAEPVAFGGYPQHVAFAFLLLAAHALGHYLEDGRRRALAASAAGLAGAALSHHVYFPLACLVAATVWATWFTTRPPRSTVRRRTLGSAIAIAVGVACFAPTAVAFRAAGYDPPLDAGGLGFGEVLRYGFREAPALWATILIGGGAGLALTVRRRRQAVWQVAAALTVVPLALLPLTPEVRLLPPLATGATLGLLLALHELRARGRGAAWGTLPVAAALALPLLLWPRADAQAADFVAYYRVVDRSLLDAAAAVDERAGDGQVVVARSRRGWPVGWWFEGLTDARIVVGSDEQWLGFPEEREQARLAHRFFAGRHSGPEVAALARETGVELLVFRKWEWIGWDRWLAEPDPVVEVVFDDGEFMVLDLRK